MVFLCNNSERVIVRDEESKKYLLTYGVKEEKVEETADSILLLEQKDVDKYWDEKYKNELQKDKSIDVVFIGVHLQVSSNKREKLKLIISDINNYVKKLNQYKIVIFNDTYKSEPDETVLNSFRECLDENKIMYYVYLNPNQLIGLINNLDIVITTKLQCGIVANCLGKYAISISVHNKTTRLYSQLGLKERQILIDDYKKGKLNEMLLNYKKGEIYNNIPQSVKQYAMKNKEELVNFIRS